MTRGSPGRLPAARRTGLLRVLVAACAVGLSATGLTTSATTASAVSPSPPSGTLEDQQHQVHRQVSSAQKALDSDSAASVAAHEALDRATAALPVAQQRLSSAQGAVVGAQAAAQAATAAARAATSAASAATAQLAAAQSQLEARRGVVAGYIRTSYIDGPNGAATQVLGATDPGELIDGQMRQRTVSLRLQSELRELQVARFIVAEQRADLVSKQQAATRAAKAATAAAARAQAAVSAASAATSNVQSLIASRQQLAARAADAEASDKAELARLQQESNQIAALLAARPRPTSGPIVGANGLLWPADGSVTSPFGYRVDPYTHVAQLHAGVDIGVGMGAPIHAAQAGTVVVAGPVQGYGNYTCIDHGEGFATCYAHQSHFLVSVGQVVVRGQEIGLVGQTGYATGPHLHFETRVNGNPVNPLQYFPGIG